MPEFNSLLTVEVVGDRALSIGLSRFADDVKDLSDAFREIAVDFHEIEQKQFDSEGSYSSDKWKPLSPAYAKAKAPGRPLLVLSGTLRESLVFGNEDSIQEIEPLRMRVGTRTEYALYHQTGTREMPQRRLIHLTDEDAFRWGRIMGDNLRKKAKEAGLL